MGSLFERPTPGLSLERERERFVLAASVDQYEVVAHPGVGIAILGALHGAVWPDPIAGAGFCALRAMGVV